jgi:hypothetical protein
MVAHDEIFFVAVSDVGNVIISTDGENWSSAGTIESSKMPEYVTGYGYCNSYFILTGFTHEVHV